MTRLSVKSLPALMAYDSADLADIDLINIFSSCGREIKKREIDFEVFS